MKLRTAGNHFDQIPTRDESDNKPLHKYHKTKDEISMRRLGMDPIKYQNQEKKCLKSTEILTEKNVDLPRTDKMNEKTLTKTFQDNEQLDIWKAESTLQNCTLESEKQSTERPETKVKSHPARPGAAPHHQGESPTPKRNLELAFQRARDKDFSSQEEKNIDVINLEVSSEIPSQQAPKSEIKTSDLENELRKTRGTLRVMTLATEQVNRHLKQRQCQLKGMEHGYQNEQRKRNAHLRKQEASREKVSKLQSETTLLKDQLHDYQNKANDKKDEIINIQTQFQDIIKIIQAQNDKHYLKLENEYMELTSETNHLKEQLDQYGKEKEVVVVRHLEKQPAGILKLQSASPRFHTNLKDKRRDLKKTLRQMTSQINDLTTKMDSASSKHLRLEANYQCFLQNLFSLKSIQDRFETIDKNQKKLEEDVVNFPRHTQGTREEGGTEEPARWDLDKKQKQTQAAAPEVSEQLRQTGFASI
ncbi:ankyrin repeat domain-containing protein 26-like [Marmota marmota marmota]|uniref:ankyrin repeat domain-containing protein 26-like n=1 Tax=Marmota marmota marmota TaxID=9994 RepID=UPI0020930A7B|nr:ankyrin repeat domain-containing protein 26-like [Marmota marmota marmota]